MPRQLYIDGAWTEGVGSAVLRVENPATEEMFAEVVQADPADVERAILAAREAFDHGPWGKTTPAQRADALRALHGALVARRSEIEETVVAEVGTPRRLAAGLQTGPPLDALRDYVDRVLHTFPFSTAMPATHGAGIGQGVVLREPAGVVAAITPFNYPFLVNVNKVAPALAAGCTVVLRPSPLTPLSALLIAEAADDAGLPAGVVNVVTGDVDAARVLTSHPAVDVVTFTGSGPVGAEIMRQAADGIKRVVLELGGKNVDLITEDADLDRAVPHFGYGYTRNSGQGCGCLTRALVHEAIHDQFVERLVAETGRYRVGPPTEPDTDLGPLVSSAQRERVERYVAVGLDEGATLVCGGGRPPELNPGYYFEPTVFTGVRPSMRIAQEEIFGPVGVVIPFRDDAEAVEIANDSDLGLTGAVWSHDPERAFRIARGIRTGQVTINGGGGGTNPHAPYGGYKRSGIGREFGEAALNEYLETKAVMWPVAGG